jgi:hypothetical protein
MAWAPLELELELEPDDVDDELHATAADITAAAPRISAPRLRPRILVIGASLRRHYPDRL